MKNKKNIYFLLPLVVIIWGLIGYKIFSGLNPAAFNEKVIQTNKRFIPKTVKQTETFKINSNYRDPFLGTIKKKKTAVRKTGKSVDKKIFVFPNVIYKGIIAPKNRNEKVFIIVVNGKQYLFKRNSVFDSIKLLSGSSQEVVLEFQNHRQTFPLEK